MRISRCFRFFLRVGGCAVCVGNLAFLPRGRPVTVTVTITAFHQHHAAFQMVRVRKLMQEEGKKRQKGQRGR